MMFHAFPCSVYSDLIMNIVCSSKSKQASKKGPSEHKKKKENTQKKPNTKMKLDISGATMLTAFHNEPF